MKIRQWSGQALCVALILMTASARAALLISAPFGMTADGKLVRRYTMSTSHGVSVTFTSYGGTVTDITMPDRQGHPAPIVLGCLTLREYETKSAESELYFGALIGRYANFIAAGHFRLDGRYYRLPITDPPNTIHGGRKGFDKRVWDVQPTATSGQRVSAQLAYTSADGEEGFPGTMQVGVTYTLSEDGAFAIHYRAVTEKDTVVNLTSHANFNLAGAGAPDGVLRQMLMVNADSYTPTDRTQIPTGQRASVQGTPFDFRKPTAIGARIGDNNEQRSIAQGYDQNWVLNKRGDIAQPQLAVCAYDPQTGRMLECLTTQPGVQIYTGNVFDGRYAGIGGIYRRNAAFTLETRYVPDSPNHANFPTTELQPGPAFDSTTIVRFGIHDRP